MPFIIRAEQLAVLGRPSEEAMIGGLCRHINDFFPHLATAWVPDQQREVVRAVMRLASTYHLDSERDLYRFINLALSYGWPFENDPARAWMHACLIAPASLSPADRLNLLVRQCIHLEAMTMRDKEQRAQFDLAAQQLATTRALEQAEAWLSRELYVRL